MKIDHDNSTITFRQSWLDTYSTCPERARLSILHPEMDELDSDEAFIGTAAHYGIEAFLRGQGEAEDIAYDFAMNKKHDEIKWTKRKSIHELAQLAYDCALAWERELYPHIPKGGKAEVTFKVPLFVHRGYQIMLSGTADYVHPNGEIWDWKTSGREYVPWEKQRYAIQPTAYSSVLQRGLMPNIDAKHDWPITFRYGVMYKPGTWLKKGNKEARKGVQTDIITVRRTQGDADWMYERIRQIIDFGIDILDRQWPQIDESGLCSEKWCPWWSMCKGKHIDESVHNVTPKQ